MLLAQPLQPRIFLGIIVIFFFIIIFLSSDTLRQPAITTVDSAEGQSYQDDELFPGPERKHAIVMAATKKDHVDWVTEELPEFEAAIYSVDNDPRKKLHTPVNKGNEGMAYLTFIIDNYDQLPNISLFLHAHKDGYPQAWHTDLPDHSNVRAARRLKPEAVLARGYVNLRCSSNPGCWPAEIQPFREPRDEARTAELAFPDAWKALMGPEVPIPEEVAAPCCGQFAASREAIRGRKKEEWEKYRQWLMDTELDSAVSGRVLEYMWHIFFGKEPVDCPNYDKCRCELYGLGVNCKKD